MLLCASSQVSRMNKPRRMKNEWRWEMIWSNTKWFVCLCHAHSFLLLYNCICLFKRPEYIRKPVFLCLTSFPQVSYMNIISSCLQISLLFKTTFEAFCLRQWWNVVGEKEGGPVCVWSEWKSVLFSQLLCKLTDPWRPQVWWCLTYCRHNAVWWRTCIWFSMVLNNNKIRRHTLGYFLWIA